MNQGSFGGKERDAHGMILTTTPQRLTKMTWLGYHIMQKKDVRNNKESQGYEG